MTDDVLLVLEVGRDADVLLARRCAVLTTERLDLPELTALSAQAAVLALAQDLVAAGGGRIAFTLTDDSALGVRCTPDAAANRQGSEPASWASSAPAVALLVDDVGLGDAGDETAVRLQVARDVSGDPAPLGEAARTRLAEDLSAISTGSGRASAWREHLRAQNRDLMLALARLRTHAEGYESPQPDEDAGADSGADSVVALYHELSEELERTNQGVVALYAEIDDKSRQLREASEAKTRFLRNISHELRSPSNSIIGLTRLLLDEDAAPLETDQRDQVNFIASSARDLLDLVNELLDLAAAESGRLTFSAQPVALADLFEDLGGITRPLLRPGVELVVEEPPADAVVHSDPTLLRHILRNLLSNAAKFTAEGRVVLRSTGLTGSAVSSGSSGSSGRVGLEVSDTGIGIAPEDLERVFEEFYQARSPMHAGVKGTGLGLAFAQRVALTLGGSVQVSSTPGAGSRFVVDLPRQLAVDTSEEGARP